VTSTVVRNSQDLRIAGVTGASVPWVVMSPTLDPHLHREKRLFPIKSIDISYT
jgi:hypothetical protein